MCKLCSPECRLRIYTPGHRRYQSDPTAQGVCGEQLKWMIRLYL